MVEGARQPKAQQSLIKHILHRCMCRLLLGLGCILNSRFLLFSVRSQHLLHLQRTTPVVRFARTTPGETHFVDLGHVPSLLECSTRDSELLWSPRTTDLLWSPRTTDLHRLMVCRSTHSLQTYGAVDM